MTASTAPGCGLPFVPQAAGGELLGSWLLRIADVYGLSLRSFLSRLGAWPYPGRVLPHWFALRCVDLQLDLLANAVRLSPTELAATEPPGCRRHWPQELGLCLDCLDAAADLGQPHFWSRCWMHPLATVCRLHGTWLTPVAAKDLARIRHATDFAGVADRLRASHEQWHVGEGPLDPTDALWLLPPWGRTPVETMLRIVDTLARALMAAHAADRGQGPLGWCNESREWSVSIFTLEGASAQRSQLTLPARLRHRQKLLNSVGGVLRQGALTRHGLDVGSPALTRWLASASTAHWPATALAWICPQAAELVQRQEELRVELGVSPRYFKACSALMAEAFAAS